MSNIAVLSRTQRIVVSAPDHISVINAGPQGPAGLGGNAASYEHTQAVASTSWVINHGLGFKPSIDVYDITGTPIDPFIIHHSSNQSEVQLLTPRTGTARAS